MKYDKYIKSKYLVLYTLFFVLSTACEDFVEVDPPRTEVVSETVFSSDESAIAAMTGIYTIMLNVSAILNGNIEVFTGMYADELINFYDENSYNQFSDNEIRPDDPVLLGRFWTNPYATIYNANAIIEGVTGNSALTEATRNQLLGEALFIRAIMHFYLVNLFGEIPYANTTSVEVNNTASRESVELVYDQIIEDLLEAQPLLSEGFSFVEGEERIRVNRDAVTALLARVYLYMEDWVNAEVQASQLIDQRGDVFILESLETAFLFNSREAIWQLKPNLIEGSPVSTNIGSLLIVSSFGPGSVFFFGATTTSDELINAFEINDNRFESWMEPGSSSDFFYPHKYKDGFNALPSGNQEYTILLRLAEQYLIRAEARAQQGNIGGAQEDLNAIRNRAGLANTTASDQIGLLDAILQERRVELFAEGGHRWLDLKRTGQADEVLSEVKDGWEPTDVLWPIPEQEIFNNPNLIQNPGY